MDLICNDIKVKMVTLVGGFCMEGLCRCWHFAMVGMKIYSDKGYALSTHVFVQFLKIWLYKFILNYSVISYLVS